MIKLLLVIIPAFAVLIGALFLACIFLCWLMARARRMFPRVSNETLEMIRGREVAENETKS